MKNECEIFYPGIKISIRKTVECFRQSSLLHSLYSSISTVGVCTKVSQYVQLYGAWLSYLLFHFRSQGVASGCVT